MISIQPDDIFSDEEINKKFINIMANMVNGKFLTNKLLAHIEFFYTSLNFSFQPKNPFKKPKKYSALHFRPEKNYDSIYERYKDLIFPPSGFTKELAPDFPAWW